MKVEEKVEKWSLHCKLQFTLPKTTSSNSRSDCVHPVFFASPFSPIISPKNLIAPLQNYLLQATFHLPATPSSMLSITDTTIFPNYKKEIENRRFWTHQADMVKMTPTRINKLTKSKSRYPSESHPSTKA